MNGAPVAETRPCWLLLQAASCWLILLVIQQPKAILLALQHLLEPTLTKDVMRLKKKTMKLKLIASPQLYYEQMLARSLIWT